jgi:YVTN family beta-propeller protein
MNQWSNTHAYSKIATRKRLEDYEQTQITLNNLSDREQKLRLWGANQGLDLAAKALLVSTGNYPQAMVYNQYNQLFYVANQLGNDVTIFDSSGKVVSSVKLEPSFSGFTSPVALATNESNGEVYVIGSISNKVYVINFDFELSTEIPVSSRPIAVAFNTSNGLLYVSHLLSNTVSVIDLSLELVVATLATETDPLSIIINEHTGSIYILNTTSESLSSYDISNNETGVITGLGKEPIAAVLRSNKELLVLVRASAELHVVDLENQIITETKSLTGQPSNITSLGIEKGFAIIDSKQNTISTLDQDLIPVLTMQADSINKGLVYDPINQSLFVSEPLENKVKQILLTEFGANPIEISDNYESVAYDFQFNPVIIKHLKVLFSGNDNAPIMKVGHRTPSGKERARTISLGNRKSPQQYLNLVELHEMENEIIDGKAYWLLTLLPKERISLLLYYEQLNSSVTV